MLNTASAVTSLNGGIPVKNSYKQTPNAHQSTGKPKTKKYESNIKKTGVRNN